MPRVREWSTASEVSERQAAGGRGRGRLSTRQRRRRRTRERGGLGKRARCLCTLRPAVEPLVGRFLQRRHTLHNVEASLLVLCAEQPAAVAVDALHASQRMEEAVAKRRPARQNGLLGRGQLVLCDKVGQHRTAQLHLLPFALAVVCAWRVSVRQGRPGRGVKGGGRAGTCSAVVLRIRSAVSSRAAERRWVMSAHDCDMPSISCVTRCSACRWGWDRRERGSWAVVQDGMPAKRK